MGHTTLMFRLSILFLTKPKPDATSQIFAGTAKIPINPPRQELANGLKAKTIIESSSVSSVQGTLDVGLIDSVCASDNPDR